MRLLKLLESSRTLIFVSNRLTALGSALYISREQNKRNTVKLQSDKCMYGMWETFFFLLKLWDGFHEWLLNWLLWRLTQLDRVGLRRLLWKGGGGAGNPSERAVPFASLERLLTQSFHKEDMALEDGGRLGNCSKQNPVTQSIHRLALQVTFLSLLVFYWAFSKSYGPWVDPFSVLYPCHSSGVHTF